MCTYIVHSNFVLVCIGQMEPPKVHNSRRIQEVRRFVKPHRLCLRSMLKAKGWSSGAPQGGRWARSTARAARAAII